MVLLLLVVVSAVFVPRVGMLLLLMLPPNRSLNRSFVFSRLSKLIVVSFASPPLLLLLLVLLITTLGELVALFGYMGGKVPEEEILGELGRDEEEEEEDGVC